MYRNPPGLRTPIGERAMKLGERLALVAAGAIVCDVVIIIGCVLQVNWAYARDAINKRPTVSADAH